VPAELGELTALRGLYLSRNKLTSVPASLGGLGALTTLCLGGNQLTSVPASLGGQGLTLVQFSAQRKRFLRDSGCIWGLFGGCLGDLGGY